jgi:3'(2'), 5'-bisphosphate nucleotidase
VITPEIGETGVDEKIFSKVIELAIEAGHAALEIYEGSEGIVIERKSDNSPLTLADRKSHDIISKGLKEIFPEIPVLSEEGKSIPFALRSQWSSFWLVDPLDGTKEFIKRNGEFTINIALMERNFPSAGVVFAPALDILYHANNGAAFKRERSGSPGRIQVDCEARGGLVAAQSRSHASPEEQDFLNKLGVTKTIQIGSSLKFCLIAEGKAHVYPRFGPMMEWDSAAGHAVVEQAGGKVTTWQGGPVRYNTESLKHNGMVVRATEAGAD